MCGDLFCDANEPCELPGRLSVKHTVSMRVVVCGLMLAFAVLARADTAEPWKVGVTDAQKKQAKDLLDAGNALFIDKNYREALAKYEAALVVWKHPAIQFNVVRCLIQLGRTDEAAEMLELALQYGAAPLEESVYSEALAYKKLLANQIAEVSITCAREIKVSLDGKDLPGCPIQRRVKPGRHQLVGARKDFLTRSIEVIAIGGEMQTVSVELTPLARAAKIEHRWPSWLPWAVFGGGLGIAGVGGMFEFQASGNMADYDRDVRLQCLTPCPATQVSTGKRDTAQLEDRVGVTLIAGGALTAVAGGVMFYLNRGRTVYAETSTQLAVVPSHGGATVTLGGHF